MFDKQPQQSPTNQPRREGATANEGAFEPVQPGQALNAAYILHLQRTIGNQAVQRMIQRQEAQEEEAPPASEIDPALLSMIDELLASQPGGAQAPPMEVIAGGTGADLTYGRIRDRTSVQWEQSMMSFTESARAAADVESPTGEEAGTRSPHIDANYALRRALVMVAWDYQQETNTADLTQMRGEMRAGSPYLVMVEDEFGQDMRRIENPTGSQILTHIQAELDMIRLQLPAGQLAELVVQFSGHGSNGAMVGVDGEITDMVALRQVADDAARNGIHITYIVDACTSGSLASMAQGAVTSTIRPNEGNLTAQQRQRLQTARDLLTAMYWVNQYAAAIASTSSGPIPNWANLSGREQDLATDLDSLADLEAPSERSESEQAFLDRRAEYSRQLQNYLRQVDSMLNGDAAAILNLPNIDQLRQQLDAVNAANAIMGDDMSRSMMEPLSRFIDALNDGMRPVLEELYQAAQQQPNQQP